MRSRVPWIRIEGPSGLALIDAMAELRAFYHGRGWYRLFGPDIPVRTMLAERGVAFEPGVPPGGLTTISGSEARVLRMTGWSRRCNSN